MLLAFKAHVAWAFFYFLKNENKEKMQLIKFGEEIEGYNVPVLN